MAVSPSGISVFSPKIRDEALVRRLVGQGGRGYVSINIYDGSKSVDADADSISLKVWFLDVLADFPSTDDPRGALIIDVDSTKIQREDVGHYYYDIGPENTQNRGVMTALWTYSVGGTEFTFTDHLQILNPMPFYDQLHESEKFVVEQVSWMFGDLFDSTEGGPYLVEPFQTHFDYERIAQLQAVALTRINLLGFPITNYGVGVGSQTVPEQLQGLVVIGTYLEVVRHLIRSYTEIPMFQSMNVTYTDRRDYMQRWQTILQLEEPNYERMIKLAKRSMLQLGRGSILVSGGLYGPNSGLFIKSMYSSQVRSFRFYPAAFAIGFGMIGK